MVVSCGKSPFAGKQSQDVALGDRFDEANLVVGTDRLLTDLYSSMVAVSAEAVRATKDTRVQEASIRWRINTARRIDEVRAVRDPRLRFTSLWTLIVQFRTDLADPERERFGDAQKIYEEFASRYEKRVTQLAFDALPDAIVRQVTPEVERLAKSVGVEGWTSPPQGAASRGPLNQIISIPLSPLSGLQGVGDTPAAINHFTETAADMTRVVENIPERARWQFELMLIQAQTGGVLATFRQELEATRAQFQQLTDSVLGLPDQTAKITAQLQSIQEPIGQNLEKANRALELTSEASKSIQGTLGDANRTITNAQSAAVAIQAAANEVRLLTTELRGPEKSATTAPASESTFQVTDVEAAAKQIRLAAAEIRAGLADISKATSIPALDQSRIAAEQMIRQMTMAGVLLIVLAFLAGLVLILIARRKVRA